MKLKPPEPCGMWIAWPDVDVIVYAADTGHAYRNHIIVHELAHMLCGHRTADDLIGPGTGALFPDLAPQLVRDALHRSGYTDPQEREAEMIASLFLKQAPADPPEAAGEMPRADAEILARIEATIVGSRLPRPVGPGAPGQPG
ncbi:toxin [Streptomyces catenulae]|uniref:Toxin n=1 Tax=Streptomyces catenulae TaxID=66875 RepID=A0ABV2YZB8_9ACTN|nr:toxin [Streptomyces catenulae]